jgi:C-terminal processing protease CtpA/Prc
VDGVPAERSCLLDWRTDDAYLPDPAIHQLLCKRGDEVELMVERKRGERFPITLSASRYSTFEAAKASQRIFKCRGKRIAYLHFWFIHHKGPVELVSKCIKNEFKDCHGLVLDLRGRGGNAVTTSKLISALKREWSPRPLAALVDSETRSAKEIIAYRIQSDWIGIIVGERTAGAVIPASFARVGPDDVLMFPSFSLGRYTDLLEGVGVSPDLPVNDAGPFSAGADPILEAGVHALARGYCRL